MMELSFNNVKKYLDATLVFTNISFNIYDGERVGIVGVNGCGKTTVLKLIAGIHEMTRDDSGNIFMPRGKTVGYLEQVPTYPEGYKVKDILNLAFQEVIEIEKEMKTLEESMKKLEGEELNRALSKYSRIQEQYEINGGYEKEEKLSKVCVGLKFNEEFVAKDFDILSGGEKTRVILGKILLENPDILLLDEPTNHLDMESTEWLESYLKTYRGIVIIVSHDRYFLDRVVNKIIEIEDMESLTYKGNYSDFVRQKEENMLIQFEQFKEQQKQIKAMEKAIKDLRDWAARADNVKFIKRAVSIEKRLEKMKRIEKPKFEKENMKLNFKGVDRSAKRVVFGEHFTKSYGHKKLFDNCDVLINIGERTAIIGGNGTGKSTFLKVLLGEDNADSGYVSIGENVKVAYLPQNIEFQNEELRVIDVFREDIDILEGKAREYLSKFMFFGGDVFKKVKHLSGGERVRLKLSKLLYEEVNLLILDEPTNHLDIDSIETLENALENFQGTIVFVSHDRYFINKISNRILSVEHKVFQAYEGNYDFYKEEKAKSDSILLEKKKVVKEKVKRVKPVDESKKRAREIEKLEVKIANLEDTLKEVNEEMEKSPNDYSKLNELYSKREAMQNELDEVMMLWMGYNEEIEEIANE